MIEANQKLVILISFLYYYSEITNYTQTATTELIVGFSWISFVILLVVCICIIRTTHSSTNEWEIYSVVVMLLMTVLALFNLAQGVAHDVFRVVASSVWETPQSLDRVYIRLGQHFAVAEEDGSDATVSHVTNIRMEISETVLSI